MLFEKGGDSFTCKDITALSRAGSVDKIVQNTLISPRDEGDDRTSEQQIGIPMIDMESMISRKHLLWKIEAMISFDFRNCNVLF